MKPEQFRRWYWLAVRMAHRGWPGTRRANRKKVARMVQGFFDCLPDYAEWQKGVGHLTDDLIRRIVDWENTDPVPGKADRYECVADIMTEHLGDGMNPYYWQGGDDDPAGERHYEMWDTSWGNRVRCCVRAGLDLAGEPRAGVIGFTVGDLRRLYGGRLPGWLAEGEWHAGPMGGPMVPAGPLGQMEDTVAMVL